MLTKQLMPESEAKIISSIRVFVYGTLKPGEGNYLKYCAGTLDSCNGGVLPAYTMGELFDLGVGYPGMAVGSRLVYGYLLSFQQPGILSKLDELEDYLPGRTPSKNLYNRDQVEIFTPQGESFGLAWVYFMSLDKIASFKGVLIPNGWWSGCGLKMDNCFAIS